jgi:hypothetical protein
MRRASAMPLTRAGPNDGDRGLRPRQDGCMGSGVAVTPPSPPLGSYLSALLPRFTQGRAYDPSYCAVVLRQGGSGGTAADRLG